MERVSRRIREVNWAQYRRNAHNIFTKLIRTKDPRETEDQELNIPTKQRLSRCLTTMDLTSLGVGSCVGTGMYLVAGMVAHKYAGPGAAISFIIAAIASIFSGVCYAEFGVRVPNTTGSAYTYSYVTVGEFLAFVIGWNMVLEYLIGTSACARAISASFDALFNGAIERFLSKKVGTIFGKPPDFLAFGITMFMTMILVAGVKKSLFFNNVLNIVNFSIWVFIITAGLFYIDTSNWTLHKGFLPYGWNGVFSGAATSFYAFIGFDIIATTGEEANNPKKSIPLAIVLSLCIILIAYVSTSVMLTLIVPYDRVDTDSALMQMFAYVDAPTCKYIVALGALAGLIVSMFGSMFPMPRVVYAMAQDGLIFKSDAPDYGDEPVRHIVFVKCITNLLIERLDHVQEDYLLRKMQLGMVSDETGSPSFATICGGLAAAVVALVVQLEILVEMMSIGTLLAYTLVSTCVLVLRYQPNSTNLIELLPQSLRTPVDPNAGSSSQKETSFDVTSQTQILPPSQRVMVRRVTRSSPDSDDSVAGDDSEEFGRDDSFLMNPHVENKFYGAVPGGASGGTTRCGRFFDAIYRRLQVVSYVCPGLLPWVDCGPATEITGMFVIKAVGMLYVFVILFDIFAAYGSPGTSTSTTVMMVLLFLAIAATLLLISRKPQNRSFLIYHAPCLPFVPAVAITTNIYLILNLSVLTLVRFTIWMTLGLIMYFKYGIKNSNLETPPAPPTPLTANPLNRTSLPPSTASQPVPIGDRNIFEGDGNNGMFGPYEYSDPLLAWHVTQTDPEAANSRTTASSTSYKQVESRYNAKTNSTTSHASSRPPWANPDPMFGNWED